MEELGTHLKGVCLGYEQIAEKKKALNIDISVQNSNKLIIKTSGLFHLVSPKGR